MKIDVNEGEHTEIYTIRFRVIKCLAHKCAAIYLLFSHLLLLLIWRRFCVWSVMIWMGTKKVALLMEWFHVNNFANSCLKTPKDIANIIRNLLSAWWKIQCEKNEFRFFQSIGSHFGHTPWRGMPMMPISITSFVQITERWSSNTIQLNDHIIGFCVSPLQQQKNPRKKTPFEMQTKNHIHKNRRCLWH